MHIAALMMKGVHRARLEIEHLTRRKYQTLRNISYLFLLLQSRLTQKHPQLDAR